MTVKPRICTNQLIARQLLNSLSHSHSQLNAQVSSFQNKSCIDLCFVGMAHMLERFKVSDGWFCLAFSQSICPRKCLRVVGLFWPDVDCEPQVKHLRQSSGSALISLCELTKICLDARLVSHRFWTRPCMTVDGRVLTNRLHVWECLWESASVVARNRRAALPLRAWNKGAKTYLTAEENLTAARGMSCMSGQDHKASLSVCTAWNFSSGKFSASVCCMIYEQRHSARYTGMEQVYKSHDKLLLLFSLSVIVDKWNKNRELSMFYGCGPIMTNSCVCVL